MKRWVIGLAAAALLWMFSMETGAQDWMIPVGGVSMVMTSVTGEPLEGAEFCLVRDLEEGELSDRKVEKKMVSIEGENRIMAKVEFWQNRQMTGEKTEVIRTDHQGRAALWGLDYGTYYLVETRAPEGYGKITSPVRISVHKYSHITPEDQVRDDEGVLLDNTLHIIHVPYTLPRTGELIPISLAAAGTGILLSAAALILLNRRRWK